MTPWLKIFVSSVQKELEDERLIVQNLVGTDPFLLAHCVPVLYEFEPASPERALDECLTALDGCNVYLLIVGNEYGTTMGEHSITHMEYRRAKESGLPVLAFIKGDRRLKREEGTIALLAEIDADGFKYKRFGNVIELQKEAITSIGIVETISDIKNAEKIVQMVSKRTVYSFEEICEMAKKKTKVILFRLAEHMTTPVRYYWLLKQNIVNGPIQTIRKISDDSFKKIYEQQR